LKTHTLDKAELGTVLTPPDTVNYMVSKLLPIHPDHKILDPCCGPGIFIEALLKNGVKSKQIDAFDLNPSYENQIMKLGVNFTALDTLLSINHSRYEEYEFIIGNPPYLNKASEYVRQKRNELKRLYGKINAHETYSMFIINAIWRLKEEGKLCFITSDSFLTLRTHTRLRRFILQNCAINEILLAPQNLFSNQGVNTSPVIVTLTKSTKNEGKRKENFMNIIPRIRDEREYNNILKRTQVDQHSYDILPFNIFHIDIENEIIDLFKKAPQIKNFITPYIGMHTHNNKKYIAAIDGTELAEEFKLKNEKAENEEDEYLIVNPEQLKSGSWKPYLKRGGAERYYRPVIEAIKFDAQSVSYYDIPKSVPFESEGIVISGVSSRLAARYMPKGCYWDSNKAIGCLMTSKKVSLYYLLGVLNSSLYDYLAKGIVNNTSSIQVTGIRALPFIVPTTSIKTEIERLVRIIIEKLKENKRHDYKSEQEKIDSLIYDFYAKKFNFQDALKAKLRNEWSK
jgi:hypothetical protein